ncbi:TetR/AcrR family transcriptional regulator [Dactylosporangium sp. CA-092794]|uniref:TetR/AcrR family transcriptional regulator n=1 Tax=Dactylosporangium sp. CA-092794 TaxID=3239929 RepID=UPI003D9455F2
MGAATTTGGPRRSDARRNRERLVEAAHRVFSAQGIDVPLDAIARDSGVGNATMYRNFPTRDALLEAVLHERLEGLTATAERLMTATPTDTALLDWLREFLTYVQMYRGLPDPVMATMRDSDSPLYASCKQMRDAAAQLLVRAQTAGTVAADIEASDLFAHATGIAWAAQRAPSPGRADRLLAILANGIRPL